MILTGAAPGQEDGNVAYVLEHELGVLATTPEALLAQMERVLRLGESELARMGANARRLSRPHAAADIARLVFSYLPGADAPSVWEAHRNHIAQARATRHGRAQA
jgi:UDP-N-acetylglucosamine:LPS N-acetylglucosamine transferase